MIITVSSVAGSPGVTSWAMLLAAAIPAEYQVERVVLEADVDGGVLGARYGVGVDPGVNNLISAARRTESGVVDVAPFGRRISQDVLLVPGPETAERAKQVWSGEGVAADLAFTASKDARIWVADIGRASTVSPVADIIQKSSCALLVTRAEQEALVQVPSRVADLQRSAPTVGVLVAGKASFSTADLATFFGTPLVFAVQPPEQLVDFTRKAYSDNKARRHLIWRSAVDVAATVMDTATSHPLATSTGAGDGR